jgi:hypothetical protein
VKETEPHDRQILIVVVWSVGGGHNDLLLMLGVLAGVALLPTRPAWGGTRGRGRRPAFGVASRPTGWAVGAHAPPSGGSTPGW